MQIRGVCRTVIAAMLLLSPVSGHLLAQGTSPFGSSAPRFLDVDEAFNLYTSLDSESQISVHWIIAPEYYLYADKFSARIVSPASMAGPLELNLPEGVQHNDEYFGDVTVYYQQIRLPLQIPGPAPQSFTLEIGFQGCAEAGLCYPPQLRQLEIYR